MTNDQVLAAASGLLCALRILGPLAWIRRQLTLNFPSTYPQLTLNLLRHTVRLHLTG